MLIHIFIFDMDTLHYPALCDLINTTENQDNAFACETLDKDAKNELLITLL